MKGRVPVTAPAASMSIAGGRLAAIAEKRHLRGAL
jgi:hypothetical protein